MRSRSPGPLYAESQEVDFVVVGSGAAGGIIANELSQAGFQVVVLEQGPYLTERDFGHDEVAQWYQAELTNDPQRQPHTFRASAEETARERRSIQYGCVVGGGTVHFTANYWRFHELDFAEASRFGTVQGTGLADWPVDYAELEPYYARVDWEIGVSGQAGANPFEPPRSRPYPVPPLPVKSSGVLFERGARELGWHAYPAPMAILSRPHDGRAACQHCGWCMYFGCEFGAKSSTLATVIRRAEATGRCEIRPLSYVHRIETDARGRVTGAVYYDQQGRQRMQRARAVVLSANGAETPRLLLLSTSSLFPHGLANSSGLVGKYLMFNGSSRAGGLFEHRLNEYKSVVVTRALQNFYVADPTGGFYGGGGLTARLGTTPGGFALFGLPPDAPRWGGEYKHMLAEYFTRTMYVAGHSTSLPLESNDVTLDPVVRDAWGVPAARITYHDHPDDLRTMQLLLDRSAELLEAAGARRVWTYPVEPHTGSAHLLGTCRMGDDPATSVVDPYHRAHDVPNLFICDGSSLVTSGRGQPTMTIQALAFRAAEHIARAARRGEI